MPRVSQHVEIAKTLLARIALRMESLEKIQRMIHELRSSRVIKIITLTNNHEWCGLFHQFHQVV